MRYLRFAVFLVLAAVLVTSGCRRRHHHHWSPSGDDGNPPPVPPPVADRVAPAPVQDLSVTATTSFTATLTWTAPGDDGNVGQVALYDLRFSTLPIATEADFAAATPAPGMPSPQIAGSPQTAVVGGLTPSTTYWFALKSRDEALNWSGLSNVPDGTTLAPPDTTPPANVTDLAVMSWSSVDVNLQWTAPGDDGTTGTACLYDLRFSLLPIVNDADFDAAVPVANPPLPSPPGEFDQMFVGGLAPSITYYFAIKTVDEAGNWSGLSNVPFVTLIVPDTTPPGAISDLAAGSATFESLTLTWTAPGDDGASGTAVSYDVRFSPNPIVTDADFDLAASAGVAPAPLAAGSPQSMVVNGLSPLTQYWFAIRTLDEVPNTSALSNIATATTLAPPDTTPPASIMDLAVVAWTDTTLTLSWTAPGDDGAVGTAALYDIHMSQMPITSEAEFNAAFHLNGEPAPLPAGSTQTFVVNGLPPGTTWYFCIRASDEVPNVGGLSNSAVGTTADHPVVIAEPEVEPNDTPGTATSLGPSLAGYGVLQDLADIDFWSFDASAGDVIRVEMSGTRRDQANWNSYDSIPILRIVDPNGNDMLRHDRAAWDAGDHDLDVPLFRVPATGTWYLRLQSSGEIQDGAYAVRVIFLAPTLTFEEEAAGTWGDNDSVATAEPVSTPAVIYGWHTHKKSDYYAFEAVADSILSFEITAIRNGIFDGETAYTNPRLWLYDPDGKKVEKISLSIYHDVEFTYYVCRPGTWTIRVVEDGGSKGSGPYFLAINSVPAPTRQEQSPNGSPATADSIAYGDFINGCVSIFDTDWFQFAGNAGDMVRIKLYDSENSENAKGRVSIHLYASDGITELPGESPDGILNTFRAILRESGTHYIKVHRTGSASSYAFELTRFRAAAWEVEPNGTAGTAMALDAGGRAAGVIDPAGDLDVVAFSASASELVTFAIYAKPAAVPPGSDGDRQRAGHGSKLAPKLTIRDSGGNAIATAVRTLAHVSAESVTNPLPTLELVLVAPASGSYTITVEDEGGAGGPTRSWVLERR